MSFTDRRVLLATALDTVTGLTGHEFRPAIVKAGSAWPILETVERGPGDSWAATWTVVVCLGGDEKSAGQLTDDVFPELVDELESTDTAYVQSAAPTTLPIGGGTMHALAVTVTSE